VVGRFQRLPFVCPHLGFWDNPTVHYSRPTRLHRCYAEGSAVPLTSERQLQLCFNETYHTCPRFVAASPPRQEANAASGVATARQGAQHGAAGEARETVAPPRRRGLGISKVVLEALTP
jgi:hypothetical protein